MMQCRPACLFPLLANSGSGNGQQVLQPAGSEEGREKTNLNRLLLDIVENVDVCGFLLHMQIMLR